MTAPLTSPHPHAHDWGASPGRAVQGLGRPIGVPGSATDGAPVSMAMHLHAAFSEKTASFEAHLAEARKLGVDVLWWTDHDFRVNAHGYREAVGYGGGDTHPDQRDRILRYNEDDVRATQALREWMSKEANGLPHLDEL